VLRNEIGDEDEGERLWVWLSLPVSGEPGSDVSGRHVCTRASADETLISPPHTSIDAVEDILAHKEKR
jgi:hypothetical protein